MLNPWVKRKWVKALRSGEYQQTRGALFRYYNEEGNTGYCCLAVLLAEMKPNAFNYGTIKQQDGVGYVADDLAIMWGLEAIDQRKLGKLNDGKKLDFPQIADWIEENL